MYDFGPCESLVSDNKIVLRDTKSRNNNRMVFLNPSKRSIRKVLIDNCVIKDGVRCDYLIIYDSIEYFVELKGSNVKHAIDQIENSINLVSKNARQQVKYCFVISSRCPLTSTSIQNAKIRFKKIFNAIFIIRNHFYEHSL